MIKLVISHPWQLSLDEAAKIQFELAKQVNLQPPTKEIRYIAGVDAAFSPDKTKCIAATVMWDAVEKKVLEEHVAEHEVHFPYIPGFLSFREIPAVLAALNKLKTNPDAIMCDGQGIAHPRGLGIASHIGVLTGLITIGCAKSRLIGYCKMPNLAKGSSSPLTYNGRVIGAVLRTKQNVRPLFISPGHQIDLESAIKLVLECVTKYRLPEPTRLADRLAAKWKKENY